MACALVLALSLAAACASLFDDDIEGRPFSICFARDPDDPVQGWDEQAQTARQRR